MDHISNHRHRTQEPARMLHAENRSVPEAESGKVPEERQPGKDGIAIDCNMRYKWKNKTTTKNRTKNRTTGKIEWND